MHPSAGCPGVNSSVVFLILYCFSGMDAFSYLPKRLSLIVIELIILSFQNVVLQIEQLNGNMVEKKDGCTIA